MNTAPVYPLGSDTQHGANAAARYAWARFEATGELPRTAAEFHASTTGA